MRRPSRSQTRAFGAEPSVAGSDASVSMLDRRTYLKLEILGHVSEPNLIEQHILLTQSYKAHRKRAAPRSLDIDPA